MPRLLSTHLDLPKCPYCNVDKPNLEFVQEYAAQTFEGNARFWRSYCCQRCAGLVIAEATHWDYIVYRSYPAAQGVSEDVPPRARDYLQQSLGSLSAPAGAVMLAASAVDSMLKAKSLTSGSLYARIEEAASSHLITQEMSRWAHEVRLDANDQRHADDAADLPTTGDAQKCIDFALALADLLFVLPARVERGVKTAKGEA